MPPKQIANDDVDNMDFDLPPPKAQQVTLEEIKKWTIIYPIYFDKLFTCANGRRVSKELAVEDPDINTIVTACGFTGFRFIPERKRHPSDPVRQGRVRIEWRTPDGKPLRSDVTTKTQLLQAIAKHLAKAIEDQPERKAHAEKMMKEQIKAQAAAQGQQVMLMEPSKALRIAQAMGASGKIKVDPTQFEEKTVVSAKKTKK